MRSDESPGSVTNLLQQVQAGSLGAKESLYRVVYGELLNRARMQRSAADSLNPTTLVHEAYLKLSRAGGAGWRDRQHFLAVAALAMRQILVDHARRAMARKRIVRRADVDPDECMATDACVDAASNVIAVDEALAKLQVFDPPLAQVVTLHWFGGLSLKESSTTLGISERTARRYWGTACDWLRRELGR